MNKYKLYFYIIVFVSYISRSQCQDITSCYNEFNVTTQTSNLVSFSELSTNVSVSSLVVSVSEALVVGNTLYTISWIDSVSTAPYVDEDDDSNTALSYTEIVTDQNSLSVDVTNSLLEIVDYDNPDRQDFIQLTIYFAFPNLPSTCAIEIKHYLRDENTKKPHFEFEEYYVTIREDFPVFLNVPQLQLSAFDFDATSPNNDITVQTPPECPFKSTCNICECSYGQPAPINFILTEYLNHDIMEDPFQFTCVVTLKDFGTPQLMSNSTITVTVAGFPDETPVFSAVLYKGTTETQVGSKVQVEPVINAVDSDLPASEVIYSMVPADNKVGGDEYFSINNSTGEVTVIRDIDNSFLLVKIVKFILKACDSDNQCTKSYLFISLPPPSPSGSESLEFEKNIYAAQIINPLTRVVVLTVYAESSNNTEDVRYYFLNDGSLGLQYFSINEVTGEIINSKNNTPSKTFSLQAIATDGNLNATTKVNIEILSWMPVDVIIYDSIFFSNISENEINYYYIDAVGAQYYCLLDIQPKGFSRYFSVNMDGIIFQRLSPDSDNSSLGTKVTIKAAAYSELAECTSSPVTTRVLSNEVLLELNILDKNDNDPYFYYPNGEISTYPLFAYPLEVPLQKAIGPVATVVTKDKDVIQNIVNYKVESYDVENYEIDYQSGELYLTGDTIPAVYIDITARNDPLMNYNSENVSRFQYIYPEVEILQLSEISTLSFDYLNQSEVETKLIEISVLSGVNVFLLYSNLVVVSDNYWKVEAHVYCTFYLSGHGYSLIDYQQLIMKTNLASFVSDLQPFSEAKYFYDNDNDNDDFKTSTIVLGCITGLLLLLMVSFLIYKQCK